MKKIKDLILKNKHKIIASTLALSMVFGVSIQANALSRTNESIGDNSRITQEYSNSKVYDLNAVRSKLLKKSTSSSEIHFINTGNSDSILIKGEKNVLIDGGNNDDEKLIVDYLQNQGVTKLDYVIATHPHEDHIGGLDAAINAMEVGQVFAPNGSATSKTYKDFINAIANKGLYPSVPLEGAKFDLGNGAYMQIFNTNGGKKTNEKSLVTLYVNGDDKALFMGDAEKGTEKEILNELTDVDLLKVGHHGSKTSTTLDLLNKVKPEIAVITCGVNNKFGHPNKETMEKLESQGIEIHRTDECGDIVFVSTGHGLETNCQAGDYAYGR